MPRVMRGAATISSRYLSPKRVGGLIRQTTWRKRSDGAAERQVGRVVAASRSRIAAASGAWGASSARPIGQPLSGIHGRAREVLGLEGAALALPVAGGAAEAAQAALLAGRLGQADDLAGVEGLRLVGVVELAGLHQRDVEAARGEASGEGDPGGTGADDADVEGAVEGGALRRRGVSEHRGGAPSGRSDGWRAGRRAVRAVTGNSERQEELEARPVGRCLTMVPRACVRDILRVAMVETALAPRGERPRPIRRGCASVACRRLVLGHPVGELDDLQAAIDDVEDAEIGDDAVDDAHAGQRQGAFLEQLGLAVPCWRGP